MNVTLGAEQPNYYSESGKTDRNDLRKCAKTCSMWTFEVIADRRRISSVRNFAAPGPALSRSECMLAEGARRGSCPYTHIRAAGWGGTAWRAFDPGPGGGAGIEAIKLNHEGAANN